MLHVRSLCMFGCLQNHKMKCHCAEADLIPRDHYCNLCFVAAAKDGTVGVPNLQLHDVKTGKCLKSFIQKKMQNW